jgi:flagellar basal body-associated protein FliL
MDAITANLNEPSFKRMVVVKFCLEAKDKEAFRDVKKNAYRLTDAYLTMLGNKTRADLSTEAGKDLLKLEARARADQIVGKGKVVFVGFDQFYFI